MSFLIAPDSLRELSERSGFRVRVWIDTTEVARHWFLNAWEKRLATGTPPLGLHLLMGQTAPAKFTNVAKNLREERITVFQGVLERA